MTRKYWGILFLFLTACSVAKAQPTPLPPTSTATPTIQPTKEPTPSPVPSATPEPTELPLAVLCEIPAPTLGAVYPADQFSRMKRLTFWNDVEKETVDINGVPIYPDLLEIEGNIINQNLRVGGIVVGEHCGYGFEVTKPDGRLVWMKQGGQLSFRPDGLGIGDGYEVVQDSKLSGEMRLWIDAAGNQTYVVVDKLGLVVDVFRPGEFAWESDLAMADGGGDEVISAGPNWVENRLASGDFFQERFSSPFLEELVWALDTSVHPKVRTVSKGEESVMYYIAKQAWERRTLTGEPRGTLEEYIQELENQKQMTLRDIMMGNLQTGEDEILETYSFSKLVTVINGFAPKNLPIKLPYATSPSGDIRYGWGYDPSQPDTLYLICNYKESRFEERGVETSTMMFLGYLLRIPHRAASRAYFAYNHASSNPYLRFEEGDGSLAEKTWEGTESDAMDLIFEHFDIVKQ